MYVHNHSTQTWVHTSHLQKLLSRNLGIQHKNVLIPWWRTAQKGRASTAVVCKEAWQHSSLLSGLSICVEQHRKWLRSRTISELCKREAVQETLETWELIAETLLQSVLEKEEKCPYASAQVKRSEEEIFNSVKLLQMKSPYLAYWFGYITTLYNDNSPNKSWRNLIEHFYYTAGKTVREMQNHCPRTERKSGYNLWLKIHPPLRCVGPARVCSPAVGTSVLRFCSHKPWADTCPKAPTTSLPQSPWRCLPSGAAQLIFLVWWAEGVQERARAQREAWSLLFSFL